MKLYCKIYANNPSCTDINRAVWITAYLVWVEVQKINHSVLNQNVQWTEMFVLLYINQKSNFNFKVLKMFLIFSVKLRGKSKMGKPFWNEITTFFHFENAKNEPSCHFIKNKQTKKPPKPSDSLIVWINLNLHCFSEGWGGVCMKNVAQLYSNSLGTFRIKF